MTKVKILKTHYGQISAAIESFTRQSRWHEAPNFIVMSNQTLLQLKKDTLWNGKEVLIESQTTDMLMGIPIALNDSIPFGEISVV